MEAVNWDILDPWPDDELPDDELETDGDEELLEDEDEA